MLQGIVSGAIWFSVFLAVHIIWFHMIYVERRARFIMVTYACCLTGNVGTVFAADTGAMSVAQMALRIFYGSLVMGCLFVLYMPFFYTIATSLSVQTLVCLEESPKRALNLGALQQRFASPAIVAGRLDVMVTSGYLTVRAGTYSVTSKGRAIAKFFGYLKEIWRLGPGG